MKDKDKAREFFDALTNSNIRMGLILGEKLGKIDYSDISKTAFNIGMFSRYATKFGDTFFNSRDITLLDNIFQVGVSINNKLLKVIILLTLQSGKKMIGDLRTLSLGLGYNLKEIGTAIYDMQKVRKQLIICNRDFNINDITSSGIEIEITLQGKNYVEKLIQNIDFVQELMLDCHVKITPYKKRLTYNYLPDKFRILIRFINEIILEEKKVLTNMGFTSSQRQRIYSDIFKIDNMISTNIAIPIFEVMWKRLTWGIDIAERNNKFEDYLDILEEINSTINLLYKNQIELLGFEFHYPDIYDVIDDYIKKIKNR